MKKKTHGNKHPSYQIKKIQYQIFFINNWYWRSSITMTFWKGFCSILCTLQMRYYLSVTKTVFSCACEYDWHFFNRKGFQFNYGYRDWLFVSFTICKLVAFRESVSHYANWCFYVIVFTNKKPFLRTHSIM